VNHVAIACGSCFLMLSFFAALKLCGRDTHSRAWAALVGSAFATAVVSRPNFIYGALGLLFLLLGRQAGDQEEGRSSRRILTLAVWMAVPFMAIGALAACYNYERFGNPFEFGARYMLGGWDQTHLARASLAGLKENSWYYFFGPADHSRYFPFVHGVTWRAVGVVPTLPFLAFALLLLCPLKSRLSGYFAFLFAVALGNLASLLLLPSGNEAAVLTSANSRYLPDLVVPFGFLAGTAMVAVADCLGSQARLYRGFLLVLLPVCAWSIVASLSLDCERLPEASYRLIASPLDFPAALVERLLHQKYGPIEMMVRLTQEKGVAVPILSSGSKDSGETLVFRSQSAGLGSFGIDRRNRAFVEGDRFALDFSKLHEVRIWMSSLFPPLAHPSNSRLSSEEYNVVKHRIRVVFDGKIVFDQGDQASSATPEGIMFGERKDFSDQVLGHLQGKIASIRHLPISALDVPMTVYGDVAMTVVLPSGKTGTSEPLVVTGEPNAGDLVFVSYLDNDHVKFGFDHWGSPSTLSKVVAVDFSKPHALVIRMGSLQKDPSNQDMILITLDGKDVLVANKKAFASAAGEVQIGLNSIGGSSCGERFTGKILAAARTAPARP
jgi:hypothetical protein